jgi:hypothetical protein
MLSLNQKKRRIMKKFITIIVLVVLGIASGCSKKDLASNDSKNAPGGKSGSTARIVIKGDYLYAVDNTSLKVVDISNPSNPSLAGTVNIGFGIETIYPFKDYLFIGSNTGMYVYSLSNPAKPKQLSQFQHITACDPVVANDSLAFVTLRNNQVCHRWNDTRQIDVIDINDVLHPQLRLSYFPHFYPYGLDILGDTLLFVCHGEDGLMVYDINKMLKGYANAEISSVSGLDAFDVIIWQNKLFVIGKSGFYQYDFSDIHNIKLISKILKNQ